ncbi:MAG TPA: hypothetical protein VIS74_06995, partial [Chthoniobacterales bacterium]
SGKVDEAGKSRAYNGAVIPIGQVRFDIRFDPKPLSVSEGDEVGLQLLFCPFGWQWSASARPQMKMSAQAALLEVRIPALAKLAPRVNYVWNGKSLIPKE